MGVEKKLRKSEKKIAELEGIVAELTGAKKKVKRTPMPLTGAKKKVKRTPMPLPLPHDVCLEIAKHVHENEALAFAMTCRGFKDAMKEALRSRENTVYTGKRRKMLLTTRTEHYRKLDGVPVSEDWIKWAFSMKWRYAARRKYNEENKGRLLTFLAGRGGFKDVLVWLRSEGCDLAWNVCDYAARFGHLDVLKYLKSEGVEFNSWTCRGAAERGHIDVLKYLKSEGVEFDKWTCFGAAQGGHLEVLKWLRSEEVNCSWDIQLCLIYAK